MSVGEYVRPRIRYRLGVDFLNQDWSIKDGRLSQNRISQVMRLAKRTQELSWRLIAAIGLSNTEAVLCRYL